MDFVDFYLLIGYFGSFGFQEQIVYEQVYKCFGCYWGYLVVVYSESFGLVVDEV